jgi:predicted ribonuclease YlaK
MVETIVLFLDTNVFLHYQSFDQIDWSALFGVANVEIIIPPVTVHELNKHKDSHPKPRIRARAADIIKKLLGLFENSLNIDRSAKI